MAGWTKKVSWGFIEWEVFHGNYLLFNQALNFFSLPQHWLGASFLVKSHIIVLLFTLALLKNLVPGQNILHKHFQRLQDR